MQQAALIRRLAVAVAGLAVLSCCGGDKPIENNVVRPGITALEQATGLACSTDADVLGKAIEAYTLFEDAPPPDEAALVTAGFLREESTLHDVVDGQVVAVDPGCGGSGAAPTTPSGSAPMTAPSTDLGEIVTSTEPPLTPEQMLAEFTPDEVAEVGGAESAGELASIFVAGQNYVAEQGKDPESIDDLAGYLDQTIDMWTVEGDGLTAVPGSGCVDPDDSASG